jgi:Mg2+/Co2+ transporter CorB
MKLFSWLQDQDTIESEETEPPLSPKLQARLEELEKLAVRDVMAPRALVTALDVDVQLRRVRRLKSSKFAYLPVYKGDLDHILGWISKRKVLDLLNESGEENHLIPHIRPVGTVAEGAPVSELADLFLKTASPILIVRNSHGSTTGIILLSEFVELIFGFDLSTPQPATTSDAPVTAKTYEL